MSLNFRSSSQMTVGAELELQLLSCGTYALSSSSPVVLDLFPNSTAIKREIFQSMIEITSAVRKNAGEVGSDLRKAADQLRDACRRMDLHIASAGTHPFSTYESCEVYPDERYHHIVQKHPWLARKLLIFGLHVHVGMQSGDHAVQIACTLSQYLPLILALSSSSPFSVAEDTQFSSSRSTLFEALPNSGQAYTFKTWSDFQKMYDPLVAAGAIESFRDLWWDIRPSPYYGTLEVRICDSPSTLLEAEAIVALIHILCQKVDRDLKLGKISRAGAPWLVRENKWRAVRSGISAEFLTAEAGHTVSVAEFLDSLLDEIPDLIDLNGYGRQVETLRKIAALGSSADRQRRRYESSGNQFPLVLGGLVDELESDVPQWASVDKNIVKSNKGGSQCA